MITYCPSHLYKLAEPYLCVTQSKQAMSLSSPLKNFIVYVDDDPDDLQFVRECLEPYAASLEVLTFQSSTKAYQFLLQFEEEGQTPCLIILDMNMPGLSGSELLPIIRAIPHFDDTPIIVFTTSNSKLDALFARKYRAGFVTKPMTAKQMETIAETFLSHCSEEIKEKIKR